ncbi:hypothetical protein DQ04_07411020 [Trypanosoma grayi]|uniref:hypothetical protein n=1 Tax=Trypanosoma grayi TaxID=71804 RepID=UPI0004F46BF8|nr:hypothetical protein DQ04_07411020 [Trypanosoma grayi]KEG08344.1 hypothetical protein DQ04_07411020 [Trypanosoma grayi]
MRPLLSLLGVPDVVASELGISDDSEEAAVAVVLRLDSGQPKQMAGYAHTTMQQRQHKEEQQRESLLANCVRGTLRGSDVLQFWTEVNRPDGVEGRTASEWLEYVESVRDAYVTCEPLFASLAYMLPRLDDTEATLQSRRAHRTPPKEQRLVPLDVIQQQLEGLQREFRWTHDGIDVTGLRADLQTALARRRITKSQLYEIERARREQIEQQKQQVKQQQPVISNMPSEMTRMAQFEATMRLYKGVIDEDVAAIRIRLPRHRPFAVPHNLFLRTALHKDVMCGTNVSENSDGEASLVLFGRVEVVDAPPSVGATPTAIKQCEIEGGVPVIHVNVSGTTFAQLDHFPVDRVVLEELPNPNRTDSTPGVGLTPCLQQLHAGMRVAMSPATRKHLYLQLSPCPAFQMLSPAEYNEHQDSEVLQRKLQLPRLLRVTLRGALAEDSHTRGRTSVSFVVEVRPTLARLHLRPLPPRGEAAAALSSWPTASTGRPLLMCEADVRRRGMELGVELIGDQWHDRVGEENDDDGYYHHAPRAVAANTAPLHSVDHHERGLTSSSAPPSPEDGWGVGGGRARRRSPHNVALVNSFSIVEHYSLDSAHHLFLKHGGLYRSHFVSYLFSKVLADPESIHRHRFIHRYNDTFVGVRIPAEPRSQNDLDSSDDNTAVMFEGDYLPPIRPFSSIEEILFAVPGIATECRGCLLADTTYFVAGDLTGLWSFPPAMLPPLDNSLLAAPLRVPFYTALRVPREWRFTTMCPTAAWESLQSVWQHWRPPVTLRGGQPFLQLELVVYSLRDMLGGEVPLLRRPTVLLTSTPLPLSMLMKENPRRTGNPTLSELVFKVNTSAAERAYAMMAADFMRYGRRHLHTVHDYLRDDLGSGGALAVNASVFLQVCVPPTAAVQESQCSIVSLTHSLLVMEEPQAASYYVQLRRGSWGSILNPAALLHHAGTAMVGFFVFPRLPAVRGALAAGGTRDLRTARIGISVSLFVALVFLYHMAARLWAVTWTLLWAALFSLVPEVTVGMYCVLHFLFWAFAM